MTEPAGVEWTPEFPGQRPPFGAANEAALVHGARSERCVGPLATQIAQELLDDPGTPDHIREPLFAAAVQAWARAEAICRLLWAWLENLDIATALTDATTTTEDEETKRNKTHRVSQTKHLPSVLDQLRRYEAHAANLRAELGLDPASAAKVGRDLAMRRHLDATPLSAALAAIEEQRRRALEAGDARE